MNFALHWPQLIWFGLAFLAMGIAAAKNGQPRPPYNVGSVFIGISMDFAILFQGGFFG